MIEFREVKYSALSRDESEQLFKLRKKTFKDRLDWDVSCAGNMEKDEYDTFNATYIIGLYRQEVVCGVRLIDMNKPNMINEFLFQRYFKEALQIKHSGIEASRLFIDKAKAASLLYEKYPVSAQLFNCMIQYGRKKKVENLYAIISHPVYIIFIRSGWLLDIIQTGLSDKEEIIYYVSMPLDDNSTMNLYYKLKNIAPVWKQHVVTPLTTYEMK